VPNFRRCAADTLDAATQPQRSASHYARRPTDLIAYYARHAVLRGHHATIRRIRAAAELHSAYSYWRCCRRSRQVSYDAALREVRHTRRRAADASRPGAAEATIARRADGFVYLPSRFHVSCLR